MGDCGLITQDTVTLAQQIACNLEFIRMKKIKESDEL